MSTIEEAKTKRDELALLILNAVKVYENTTGVKVTALNISDTQETPGRKEPKTERVTVDVIL